MAVNPSEILLPTQQDKNEVNDSKTASEQEQAKQDFKQFQHDLVVMKPELASEDSHNFPPFSTYFPNEITHLMISYIREAEIPSLAAIAPPILYACRSEVYKIMGFKRLVSEKLLPHVFGAEPDGVDAFLRMPDVHPKMLLTETHYTDGYNSPKLGRFVCFERYKAISALKGAYRCGDGPFLGRRILAYLLRDNTLPQSVKEGFLCEARQQLLELWKLVETEIRTETANAKTLADSTVAKANVGAAAAATASAATGVKPNGTPGSKEKAELDSGSSADTDGYADSLEFLSAIVKLIKAYKAYLSQYDSLVKENKQAELGALWGEVCECQKRVYHYVKLEFFNPMPWSKFDLEPRRGPCRYFRGPCRYFNNTLLDLDEIGRDTAIGLYKGWSARDSWHTRRAWDGARGARRFAQFDLKALRHLYKLRVDDLRNTIDQLHSLESALSFISNVKPKSRIDL